MGSEPEYFLDVTCSGESFLDPVDGFPRAPHAVAPRARWQPSVSIPALADSSRAAAGTSLGAIGLAEVVTVYVNPLYGVLAHMVLLGAFLSLGALARDERRQAFFLTMALAPLIRILSLGMPLGRFPQPYWYVLTALPLFAAAWSVARTLGIHRTALNLRLPSRRRLPIELAIAATGFALGVVEWHILHPRPIVSGSSIAWLVAAPLILLVFTGFVEELLFRGLIQYAAGNLLGPNGGLAVTVMLFAIMHTGWRSPLDLAFVSGVAVYFGLAVRYTQSLTGVTIAHGAINTMLFVVLPLAIR